VRSARAVIVPSNYLQSIVAAWGVERTNIRVIYNSVLLEEVGNVPSPVTLAPRPHIVTVGRFVPWKNITGVIDAVAELRTGTLIVVGEGPERHHLEAHAKKMLPATVFTGGLSHKDTLAVLEEADVFVLNSTYEGLSHLLIEAMSLGVPTVATDTGGNTELLQHEVGSALVEVNNTPALTSAVSAVLAQKKRTESTFRVRFAPATMLQKTAELLQQSL
jgi:glycosyltransferase involved in cell wall biosynthesis